MLFRSDEAGLKQLEVELKTRYSESAKEIEAEISLSQGKRNEQVPQIDKGLLDLYEKIKGSSGGVGAALLVGNTCDGCHLSITPVELDKIKSQPKDEVVRCEECRRILVRI